MDKIVNLLYNIIALWRTSLTRLDKHATNGALHMDLSKAIELLERSEHVGLLLPSRPDLDVVAAAEVTARLLRKRGKAVGLLETVDLSHLPRKTTFETLETAPKLPKEFIVTLDTSQSPASELRYEKADDRIDIIFSPRGESIQKEHISFRDGKVQCDCIVSFGVSDIDMVAGTVRDDPDIFTRTPIINIDSSKDNKHFAEINLTDERPHAEVAYLIRTAMEQSPPTPKDATLLLAGILSTTKHLSSPLVKPETLLSVSELVRAGAAYTEALQLSKERVPLSSLQLFGRAHVRSKIDTDGNVFWSFLTADDYEKTGKSDEDAGEVLTHILTEAPWDRLIVLLSQNVRDSRIQVHLAGDTTLLSKIAESTGSEWAGDHLTLQVQFENFKDAEDYVRSLITPVL